MKLDDVVPKQGFIREYYDYARPLTEAPSKMHLSNSFVCIASVVGRRIGLPWGNRALYPNIYKMDIGPSGIYRKSSANAIAKDLIEKIDTHLVLPDLQSIESFIFELRTSTCRVGFYDELRVLTDNARKKYGEGLIPLFTQLWDCPPSYRVSFKNIPKEDSMIYEPCLSLATSSTPEWIMLEEADVSGGFLGRFILVKCESDGRIIPIPSIPPQSRADSLVRHLKALREIKGTFRFTTEGKQAYESFYRKHREESSKENNYLLGSFYSRMDVHIIKIAMILQLSLSPDALLITQENIEIANIIMEESRTDYREIIEHKVTYSQKDRNIKKIREYIIAHPGIEHCPLLRNSHLVAKELREVVETLIESGEIRKVGNCYWPEVRTNSQEACERVTN